MNETGSSAAQDGWPAHAWLRKLQQARFTHLLVALALLLFTSPFINTFSTSLGRIAAIVLVSAVLAVVLIAAALAVSENRRQSQVALGLAIACLAMTLVAHLLDSPILRGVQELLIIGFLIHVVQLIVGSLFRRRRVDHDTIAASLCGYLIIGVAFAVIFSLVMEIDETAISAGSGAHAPEIGFRFGDQHTATSLYFSFVTLTTLGYGDAVPASMPARMLAVAEALIGQLYLVVLVARLVGLHIATELTTVASDNED